MTWPGANRGPLIIAGALVALALVFHARLIDWFAGATGETIDERAVTPPAAPSDDIAYYTCSMHPAVRAHQPGKCPVCSMELRPVTRRDEATGVVQLDEARQRAIGVRTEKATTAPMFLDIRAVGKLAYDQTRLTDVALKLSGYVSGLRVAATGQLLRKGEAMFQLSGPELFAAEQDLVVARRSRDALGDRGDELVRATEAKLALLGITPEQIQAIASAGAPLDKLSVAAPASGYVIENSLVEGAAIKAGDRLLRIAALDKLWVEADVFEADLARIARGQAATISLSYLPGQTFHGTVAFVYPYLDPGVRTGRVRIELANAALALKPDMYADVTVHVSLGERLQIPTSAIIFTGPRRIVIVDLGGGRLAPREIQPGVHAGDRTEVVSGLGDGDAVVVAGNFLIAAESRIRSAATFWKDAP